MMTETDGQSLPNRGSSRLLFLLFHGVLMAFCIRIYQDRAVAACKRLDELLGGRRGCGQRGVSGGVGLFSSTCSLRYMAVNVKWQATRSVVVVTIRILLRVSWEGREGARQRFLTLALEKKKQKKKK